MDTEEKSIHKSFVRLASYCAYRERCRSEIVQKMKEIEIPESHFEAVLERLAADNFWDEARFARHFVSGKFRHNNWGRLKIRLELQSRCPDERLTEAAMREIDAEEYSETLLHLAEKHCKDLSDTAARLKTINYLKNKGYEPELIRDYFPFSAKKPVVKKT